MEYPSLADIAAVTGGEGKDGMFGGGYLIMILILFLILTMGGGAFGANRGTPVTEADLCNANSFSELKAGVARNADGISNMSDCCCTTQRGIDSVNYNGAINTSNIIQAQERGTQKILDAICGNRMADMQAQINNLQLQAALCGVVRYPNAITYGAGPSPFFGGCCDTCNI